MRVNSTKQPFAWFRTATRKRGRPAHRVYILTPRPPMTGQWLWFYFGGNLAYSKDGSYWWLLNDRMFSDWSALKTGPDHGTLWNQLLWHVHTIDTPSWPSIGGGAQQVWRGNWGPCPYTPDDSFSVP